MEPEVHPCAVRNVCYCVYYHVALVCVYSSAEHKATMQNMAKPIPKMSFEQIGEGLKNIDMSLSLGRQYSHLLCLTGQ